jgi:hypothetical protein
MKQITIAQAEHLATLKTTTTMTTYKMTKSELTSRAKNLGYSIKIADGEIEAFPKGMRGDASIFESDDADGSGRNAIIATIKADRASRFAAKLEGQPISEEAKQALIAWHAYHGAEWLEALQMAWMYGRYDGFAHKNESGTLQRLRNTNGHSVIAALIA